MKLHKFCQKTIAYSFYALFFFVPLVFAPHTSELFELNKMWITFGLTAIIACAWGTKMIVQRKLEIQRTPLDILLLLFFLSQFIATLFSLDQRISFWGYYSRFNGGLLSTICYLVLYYAFVSNLSLKHVYKTILVMLTSGVIVTLWGIPAHFGKDPTCLLIRGTLDVSCWTDQFQPTVRIFSTLGQPAWLASFLASLLPISMALIFLKKIPGDKTSKEKTTSLTHMLTKPYFRWGVLILTGVFYLGLLFANTRAGFLGFWIGNSVFWVALFSLDQKQTKRYGLYGFLLLSFLVVAYSVLTSTYALFWMVSVVLFSISLLFFARKHLVHFSVLTLTLLALTFLFKSPFPEINQIFSLDAIRTVAPQPVPEKATEPVQTSGTVLESGGTESASIRRIVWKGAIDAWISNPIFGTGVETFAFAYYKHRPAEHNMTSEWDYLYNKAHNEYLNYLTTTGIFGLGTYLVFIGYFLFLSIKKILSFKSEDPQAYNNFLLSLGLGSGFMTILVANFFGFSVVITNLYLFFFPLFVFYLLDMLPKKKLLWQMETQDQDNRAKQTMSFSPYQWTGIVVITLITLYFLISLLRFWQADTKYALGNNLSTVGEYAMANPLLMDAVRVRSVEPVFTDALAINNASLLIALLKEQGEGAGQQASTLAEQAVMLSDRSVLAHPNNILVWKNRVRMYYLLAQANPSFYEQALVAMEKSHELAPTDAKTLYNLGVLYGQIGQLQKGIDTLTKATELKPNYIDAYFAKGLFYHELALKDEKIADVAMQQKAVETMQYILTNLSPDNKQILDTLASWEEK